MTPLHEGIVHGKEAWRAVTPPEAVFDPARTDGPILLEEADYEVYARSRVNEPVSLHHDDPLIEAAIRAEEDGRVLHGVINFGSQIGRSVFRLWIGRSPEVSFEVEVFPSKLDYMADYRRILAEVQEIATGLGLEYLSATRQGGKRAPVRRTTDLEWTRILASVVDDLERALRHVAERPLRGLERREGRVRAEKVTRVDATIRAAVVRGRGDGPPVHVPGVGPVRARLPAGLPTPTLDTPEHRWLAAQLADIRRRLAEIRGVVAAQSRIPRRQRALHDLDRLEAPARGARPPRKPIEAAGARAARGLRLPPPSSARRGTARPTSPASRSRTGCASRAGRSISP